MTTLFYSIGFIFLYLEFLTVLTGRAEIINFIKKTEEAKTDKEKKELFKNNLLLIFWMLLFLIPISFAYFVWMLAGLFSAQWIFFAGLISLLLLSRLFPKTQITARIDALASFVLILAILIGYFR